MTRTVSSPLAALVIAVCMSTAAGAEPAEAPHAAGWGTYMQNNARTGVTPETLALPLTLQWTYRCRRQPAPAWPPPAKNDYWHGRSNLKPRVTYDRAYHLVAAGSRVYFGSSADDTVTCLDAATGREVWRFFTEGPVRLAPTVAGDHLLFGSDDGRVYCLNRRTGRLAWTYRHAAWPDRRIAGNGRIISDHPVRTGVLVDGDRAYFCAGMFPAWGVELVTLDVRTGRKIESKRLGAAMQGYLARRGDRLHGQTGRDTRGAFVASLARRGKAPAASAVKAPAAYPYAFIGAGEMRFGGAEGKVAAVSGAEARDVWSAQVEGKAYSLAVAGGRLLVSTDKGMVYGFAPTKDRSHSAAPASKPAPYPSGAAPKRTTGAARQLIAQAGVTKGYALIGPRGGAPLACELARLTTLRIVCVESDPARAAAARAAIDAADLYGRVVVHRSASAGPLPYADGLFNLVVWDDRAQSAQAEAMRVCRPFGGTVVRGIDAGQITHRGPGGGGQWSHMYATPGNTACSGDATPADPLALQWFGRPGPRNMVDRHHRVMSPLWQAGRLFVPGDSRVLALDACNGTMLWERHIPGSLRVGALRNSGHMALAGDRLYVAAADKCIALDTRTGQQGQVFTAPPLTGEVKGEWGYLAAIDGVLVGSVTPVGASWRTQSATTLRDGCYYDNGTFVCSRRLFALDARTGRPRWTYDAKGGLVPNPTIAIDGGKVFAVESAAAETLKDPDGRVKLPALLAKGAFVTALDLGTGKLLWRTPCDLAKLQHSVYLVATEGKVVVTGSRNLKGRLWYHVHVLDAATGKPAWSTSFNRNVRAGTIHGEQDQHPLVVAKTLYLEPYAYALDTGQRVVWGWPWVKSRRGGCGALNASATTIFFRNRNPYRFDLASGKHGPLTRATRPGCWINILPVGGMVLIPEASSGCICNFPIQTSLGLAPAKPTRPPANR